MGTLSRLNWNLEMLVFEERGRPELLGENLSKDERKQQTQTTYEADNHQPIVPRQEHFIVLTSIADGQEGGGYP